MRRRNINKRIQLVWLGQRNKKSSKTVKIPDITGLEKTLQVALTQLQSEITKFDISLLLPMITLINMSRRANTPQNTIDSNSPAFIEYLTALSLKNNFLGSQRPTLSDAIKIRDLVEHVFFISSELFSLQVFKMPNIDQATWGLLTSTSLHYLLVRGETSQEQFFESAEKLFSPHSEYLMSNLGFSVEQAISYANLLLTIVNTRLAINKKKLIELFQESKSTICCSSVWPTGPRYSRLVNESSSIMRMLPEFSQRIFLVSIEELLRRVNQREQKSVQDFLNFFSINPGDVNRSFSSPYDTNPIQRTPLTRLGNHFLLHTTDYIARCLFYSLDKVLADDESYRERYNKSRALYLERESLIVFQNMFPNATIHHRLRYTTQDKNKTYNTELDGLVHYDNNIFLIECASHAVTKSSKKGLKEPIIHDVKKTIDRTFRQAWRAKQYILDSECPTFKLTDGSIYSLDKSSISNYFLISVTLDSFDIFAADPKALKSLGLFGDEYSWPIHIECLKEISKYIDFPTQFVHYLKKRQHTSEKLYASDERDYFGAYLIFNLDIPNPTKRQIEKVTIVNASSDFDRYRYYKLGIGGRVPKPAQYIPRHMKSIIDALERAKQPNYTETICFLLDIDFSFRKTLNDGIASTINRFKASQQLKDFTLMNTQEKWGITYFCGNSEIPEDRNLIELLPIMCLKKLHETGCASWLGILRDTSMRRTVAGIVFLSRSTESN